MKTDMRRELARQPFEQKIRQVARLIQLAANFKAPRAAERPSVAASSVAAVYDRRTMEGRALSPPKPL